MRLKSLLLSLAAAGMVAAPVAASAAPAATPAASLSSTRAGSPGTKGNNFLGADGSASIFAIVIIAGIIAIGVVAATNDDKAKSP